MSIRALNWAYEQPADMGLACKATLVALANYADEHGSCYPGQELLAQMTGQSTRSVRRQIAKLKDDLKLITVEVRRSPDGSKNSNRYFLALEDTMSSGEDQLASGDQPQEDTEAHLEDTVSGLEDTQSSEPIEEPKEEPIEQRAPARARASRLPDNWKPNADDHRWAQKQGYGELFLRRELEKFKNYWGAKSGKDATKVKWSLTWRNWMINADDWTGNSAANHVVAPAGVRQMDVY